MELKGLNVNLEALGQYTRAMNAPKHDGYEAAVKIEEKRKNDAYHRR